MWISDMSIRISSSCSYTKHNLKTLDPLFEPLFFRSDKRHTNSYDTPESGQTIFIDKKPQ